MSKRGSRAPGRAVLAAVLLAAAVAHAAPPLRLTGWDARAAATARAGALKRLERDECRKLFTDFADARAARSSRTTQRVEARCR